MVDAVTNKYRPLLEGKQVMLFVGGLRPRHVIGAYEDLGMEDYKVVLAMVFVVGFILVKMILLGI